MAKENRDFMYAGTLEGLDVIAPGELMLESTRSIADNQLISDDILIDIPDGQGAFVYTDHQIEDIIATPGTFEYRLRGTDDEDIDRYVSYFQLEPIYGFLFGTPHAIEINERKYYAYGRLSLQITNPKQFLKYFFTFKNKTYALTDDHIRIVLLTDFLKQFENALIALDKRIDIGLLEHQKDQLSHQLFEVDQLSKVWEREYGLSVLDVILENIETDEVEKVSKPISKDARADFEWQIEQVRKLKELMDDGILSAEEFEQKKKEVMKL